MGLETIEYEKINKKGIFLDHVLILRSLMSYYIKNESIYEVWYKGKRTTCMHRLDSVCTYCTFLNKIGA